MQRDEIDALRRNLRRARLPQQRLEAVERLGEGGPDAVEPLLLALDDPVPEVRAAAVRALARAGGVSVFPRLARILENGVPAMRAAVLDALEALGRNGDVEPLCAALSDPAPNMQIAAAAALGGSADPRAARSLLEALRRGSVGGSARSQLVLGTLVALALAAGFGLLYTRVVVALDAAAMGMLIFSAITLSSFYFQRRRDRSKVVLALSQALARIAEQSPTRELRSALPELLAVAADITQQQFSTRQASHRAAASIAAATADLQDLPVAASPPPPKPTQLPLPAAGGAPEPDRLPRIVP